MRRHDREITDINKIHEIIDSCQVCRLGFNDNGEVYIVPLNFGASLDFDRNLTLYFHGAKAGRKYELIKKGGRVSFEMDTGYTVRGENIPCQYTAAFQSVMGTGTILEVTNSDEIISGLNCILKQATGRDVWTYSENMLSEVCVFKVVPDQLSCKVHL